MKPKQPQIECPVSWDEMPEWANFITIDADGEIDAWEVEPRCHKNWVWVTTKSGSNVAEVGKYVGISLNPDYCESHIWQREN